jgi:hypothetical protein
MLKFTLTSCINVFFVEGLVFAVILLTPKEVKICSGLYYSEINELFEVRNLCEGHLIIPRSNHSKDQSLNSVQVRDRS